jgi:hypothetical protein
MPITILHFLTCPARIRFRLDHLRQKSPRPVVTGAIKLTLSAIRN